MPSLLVLLASAALARPQTPEDAAPAGMGACSWPSHLVNLRTALLSPLDTDCATANISLIDSSDVYEPTFAAYLAEVKSSERRLARNSSEAWCAGADAGCMYRSPFGRGSRAAERNGPLPPLPPSSTTRAPHDLVMVPFVAAEGHSRLALRLTLPVGGWYSVRSLAVRHVAWERSGYDDPVFFRCDAHVVVRAFGPTGAVLTTAILDPSAERMPGTWALATPSDAFYVEAGESITFATLAIADGEHRCTATELVWDLVETWGHGSERGSTRSASPPLPQPLAQPLSPAPSPSASFSSAVATTCPPDTTFLARIERGWYRWRAVAAHDGSEWADCTTHEATSRPHGAGLCCEALCAHFTLPAALCAPSKEAVATHSTAAASSALASVRKARAASIESVWDGLESILDQDQSRLVTTLPAMALVERFQ